MPHKPADRHFRIEILPYAEAPWAPTAQGTSLRWAWRIVDESGQSQMVGSSSLSEQEVRLLVESAITRVKGYGTGKPAKTTLTLKQKAKSNLNDNPSAE